MENWAWIHQRNMAAVHRMSGVVRKRRMPVLEEKGVIAKSDI